MAWRCCTCRRQKDAIFLSFEQQEKHFNIFENYFPYQLIPCMPLGGQRQRQRWPKNKNKTKANRAGKKAWEVELVKAFCGAPMAPRYAPPHTHTFIHFETHTRRQPATHTHSLIVYAHSCMLGAGPSHFSLPRTSCPKLARTRMTPDSRRIPLRGVPKKARPQTDTKRG